MIAQDVEPLVPQAVTTGKDGIKQVSYTTFVPLLIEAVKDIYHHFTERIDSQDRAIASVKTDADAKDKEIAALKIRAEKAEKEAADIKARLERIEKALSTK